MKIKVDTGLADGLGSDSSPSDMASRLFAFMERTGNSSYDEYVTQLEHAIQAAMLARQSNASSSLVVAALLHDIGHFMTDEHDLRSDFTEEDWRHEEIGADQLAPYFDSEVIEPIRLHVPAKRFLCAVDSDYFRGLSPASKRSLELQGGPFTKTEIVRFEQNPHFQSAVLLRRWDDGAKIQGLTMPSLESFRADVEACIRPTERAM